MNRIIRVARLQMNKPNLTFGAPLMIIAITMVISMLIVIAIQRAGADPLSPGYVDGARRNTAMVTALPGFFVYFGVQAVATTFPLALVLGATRRSFVFGTALANLVQSVYVGLVFLVLLGLELVTGHWFMNLYVLDVYVLGAGSPWKLFVTAVIGTFLLLTIGGLFGAMWVRAGTKGPLILGLLLALTVAIVLVLLAPHLVEVFQAITPLGAGLAAVAAALLALLGTWASMRRTSVR